MNFNFTFPPTFEESPSSPPVMSPLSSEEQYNAVELKSQLPALEEVLSHPALQQYVRRFEEVCVVPKNLIEYVQLHLEELLSVLDEANANIKKECDSGNTENNSIESNSNNNNSNSTGDSEDKSKSSSNTNEEGSDEDDDYNNNDAEPKCSTWISNCNTFKVEYVNNDDVDDNNNSQNETGKNSNSVNMKNKLVTDDIVSSNACNDSLECNSFTNNDNARNCLHKEECEVPELILSANSPSKHFDPTRDFVNKPHSPLSCDCNSFDSINEVNVSSIANNNNTRANGRMEEDSCEHEDKIKLSEKVLCNEEKNVVENDNVEEVNVDLSKSDVNEDTRRLRCANAGELLLAYMIDTTSVYLIDKLVPIYLEVLCGSTFTHLTEDCNNTNNVFVENENINNFLMKSNVIIEVEFAHHALLTCFDTSFVETTRCIKNALTSTMIDRITANLHHYSVVETLISLFGSALPATTMMAASTEPCIFTEHWVGGKFVERAVQRLPIVICSCAHYNYFQFWREVIKRGFGHSAGPIVDVFLKEECINFFVQVTVAECHKLIVSTENAEAEVKDFTQISNEIDTDINISSDNSCNSVEESNNNDSKMKEEHYQEAETYHSSLCGEAISILVTIVNFVHRASITTCNRDMYYSSISNNAALYAIVEHLPSLVSLLNPEHTLVVENECLYIANRKHTITTNNHVIRLLGNVRLQICKLCLELLQLNRCDIDKALISSHFLPHLLILCRMYSQHAKLNEILQEYLLHIISRVPLEQETYVDLLTHDIQWLEYLTTFSDCINENTTPQHHINECASVQQSLIVLCQEQLSSLLSQQSYILHHLAEYAKDVTLLHTSLSANAIYTLEQMHALLHTILDTMRHSIGANTCNLESINYINALQYVNSFLTQTLQETVIRHRLENINHGIEGVNFASPETLTLPVVVHKPVINFAPDREVSSPSTFTSPVMNQKWLFTKQDYANNDHDECTSEQESLKTEEREANVVSHSNDTSVANDSCDNTSNVDTSAKVCTTSTNSNNTNTAISLPWVDKNTPEEAMYNADDVVMVDVDSEDETSDDNNEDNNNISNNKNEPSNQNNVTPCDEFTLQQCVREEVKDEYVLERTLTSVLAVEIECESSISQYCQNKCNCDTNKFIEVEQSVCCNTQMKTKNSETNSPQYPLLITDVNNAEPRLLLTWHKDAEYEQRLSTTVPELETELVTNYDAVANAQVQHEHNTTTSATYDNATQNSNECCLAKELPPELAEILKEGVAARRTGSAQVQAYPCFHTIYFGFKSNDIDDFAV